MLSWGVAGAFWCGDVNSTADFRLANLKPRDFGEIVSV